MIDVRYLDYVRAQSRAGAVACLSGRTVAYRRDAVLPVLEHLEDEFFLGRRCVAGDDGRLTWLVLASGYKTVYQSSARAVSMFPDTGTAFLKHYPKTLHLNTRGFYFSRRLLRRQPQLLNLFAFTYHLVLNASPLHS